MAFKLVKIANDFNTLSASEKEALFENYEHASITALKTTLEKFKIVAESSDTASRFTAVGVSAVPNDLLVLPKTLFGSSFDKIKKLTITENISDSTSAKIRYAITKDLTDYYTFSNGAFMKLATVDVNSVLTDGITATQLAAISETEWSTFYDGTKDVDGVGICFAFSETSISQKTAISNLDVLVDLRYAWTKAINGTDYTYSYTGNSTLSFNLLKAGSYKINYQENSYNV